MPSGSSTRRSPVERDRPVHLAVQLPPHVERDGGDRVQRSLPGADGEPGLLLDLAGETGEDGVVGGVDHATRGAPVAGAVATPVLHEQQPAVLLDDRPGDGHAIREALRHTASVACPRYHPRVPEAFDTGPGPKRGAFLLAYAGVVLAGVLGAVIGYGWGEVGCTGDCGSDATVGADRRGRHRLGRDRRGRRARAPRDGRVAPTAVGANGTGTPQRRDGPVGPAGRGHGRAPDGPAPRRCSPRCSAPRATAGSMPARDGTRGPRP